MKCPKCDNPLPYIGATCARCPEHYYKLRGKLNLDWKKIIAGAEKIAQDRGPKEATYDPSIRTVR